MAIDRNGRRVKTALFLSVIAMGVVFLSAMKLLDYARKENPEYTRWKLLPDKTKILRTDDGQPVHPMPEKQVRLTRTEILILSGGMAFFAPLLVFPLWLLITRRRK